MQSAPPDADRPYSGTFQDQRAVAPAAVLAPALREPPAKPAYAFPTPTPTPSAYGY
ncbi:MAG TPA: hypothetical protein VGL99_31720 [Chloroflexota bacterium]